MLTETGICLLLSSYTIWHYHPYTGIDLVVETRKDHWLGWEWEKEILDTEIISWLAESHTLKPTFWRPSERSSWGRWGTFMLLTVWNGEWSDPALLGFEATLFHLPPISNLLSFCSFLSYTLQFHVNSEESQRGAKSNLCLCHTSENSKGTLAPTEAYALGPRNKVKHSHEDSEVRSCR